MSSTTAAADTLDQVHELNRLFLKSLQTRDAAELGASGFPPAAIDALRSAGAEQIDGLAEFPRALFRLDTGDPLGDAESLREVVYTAQQILELTILFCAWNVSRDSIYQARLFFGLAPRTVHALRTTALSELPRLALTRARVDCAFGGSEWLWRELLTETRPETRRQLILIALQPSLEGTGSSNRVAEHARAP